MPPKHRAIAVDEVPQVVAAKLAQLQARGILAPPSTGATAASGDRVSTRPSAKAIGVIIPAYLSLEELCVKSSIVALRDVALPLAPIPLPTRAPAAVLAAGLIAPAVLHASDTRVAAAAAADSVVVADKSSTDEPSGCKDGGCQNATTPNPGPAAVAAAAAAAAAALTGLKAAGLPKQDSATQPGPAADTAVLPPQERRRPPPGFGTAAAVGATGAHQQNSAPAVAGQSGGTGGVAVAAVAAAAPKPQGPTPASPLAGDAAMSSTQSSSANVGTDGASDPRLSPPPPRTPIAQAPPAAACSLPPSGASNAASASQRKTAPLVLGSPAVPSMALLRPQPAPPPQPQAALTLQSQGAAAGGCMKPVGVDQGATYGQTYAYGQEPYQTSDWQYALPYNPYAPYALQFPMYPGYPTDANQYAGFQQIPYPYYQPQLWGAQQVQQLQQQPQAGITAAAAPAAPLPPPPPPPQQQLAGPRRPPLLPPSMAPVPLMFGPPRGHAIMAALRRALIAIFTRQPDIFRSIFGFDLKWWSRERGKPLGEDDLLTVLPWSDYATVLIRSDAGAAPALHGGPGGPGRGSRRRRRLLLNPVLSGLLGRRVYGNALVVRLRLDFAVDVCPTNAAGGCSGSGTDASGGECGSGELDLLLCAPLSAVGLREVLLRAETLAWHLRQCSDILKGMNLTPEVQTGWLGRLPRTPLDERGDPDLATALQLAAEAAGLPPLPPARAAALVAAAAAAAEGEEGGGDSEDMGEEESGLAGGLKQAEAGGGKGVAASALRAATAGGSEGAVPAALAPLLRCVRCSSPWCSPANSKIGGYGGGRRSCPFGHVWRSLELDPSFSSASAPTPIFNAARPAVLGSAFAATTHGSAGPGVNPLQPAACTSLLAYLGDPSLWSSGLLELVAAAVEGSVDEAAAALAAEAAAEALTGMAGRRASADGRGHGAPTPPEPPHHANGAAAEANGEHAGVYGSNGSSQKAAGTEARDNEQQEGRQEPEDPDAAREAMYAAAAAAVRPDRWPYYLSYCQQGAQCPNCHSCHELRLAVVAQRLRNRGRPSKSRTAPPFGGATALASGASEEGARLGFGALAEYEGDPYDIELKMMELQAGTLRGKRASSKGPAPESQARCASAAEPQPAAAAATAPSDGAAGSASHVTEPVADVGKLNWADDAEDAEAQEAATTAAIAAATAAAAAAVQAAHARVPPTHRPVPPAPPPQPTGLLSSLTSQQRMFRPPPPPSCPPPKHLLQRQQQQQQPQPPPLEGQRSITARAPLFCAAAPAPISASGGNATSSQVQWSDTRPLPQLPDHLDYEDIFATALANASAAADAAVVGGSDSGASDSPTGGAAWEAPDRATVVASMAAKSRNGVYVPPHLRTAAGQAEAEAEAGADALDDGLMPAEAGQAAVTETEATGGTVGSDASASRVWTEMAGEDGRGVGDGPSPPPPPPSALLSRAARPHNQASATTFPIPVPVPVPIPVPIPPSATAVQQQQRAQQPFAQSQHPQHQLPDALRQAAPQAPYGSLPLHHPQQAAEPHAGAPQPQESASHGSAASLGAQHPAHDTGDDDDVGDLLSLLVPPAAEASAEGAPSHPAAAAAAAGSATTGMQPPHGTQQQQLPQQQQHVPLYDTYGNMATAAMESAPPPFLGRAFAQLPPAAAIWSSSSGGDVRTQMPVPVPVPMQYPHPTYQPNQNAMPYMPYPQPLAGQFPLHSFAPPIAPLQPALAPELQQPQPQQAHGFSYGPWGLGYSGVGTAPAQPYGMVAHPPGTQQQQVPFPQLLQTYSYPSAPYYGASGGNGNLSPYAL